MTGTAPLGRRGFDFFAGSWFFVLPGGPGPGGRRELRRCVGAPGTVGLACFLRTWRPRLDPEANEPSQCGHLSGMIELACWHTWFASLFYPGGGKEQRNFLRAFGIRRWQELFFLSVIFTERLGCRLQSETAPIRTAHPQMALGGLGQPRKGSSRDPQPLAARHTHPGGTVTGWVGRW